MARKPLTEEQKKVLADRLKKAREVKKTKKEDEEKDVPEENSTAALIPPTDITGPSITGGNPYIGGHSLNKEHIG